MRANMNTLILGDCLQKMKELPDCSIDCVVTSPPYWALRDYGVAGQLGLEPTFKEYVTKLCDIFDEVKRVLKKEGTCWVNLGDTYSWVKVGNTETNKNNAVVTSTFKKEKQNIPAKSLCCIPDRFKIEMIDRGWICRNEIIWYKPNCMPVSVKDRFTVDYEKVFFFVKSKKYFFKQQIEDGKGVWNSSKGFNEAGQRRRQGSKSTYGKDLDQTGRNKRCVWQVSTKPFKEAHFATYPEKLIEPMIDAGCPVGGIVLDPFFGAGTTAIVAIKQGKSCVGIDLNAKYLEIAQKRIDAVPSAML